MKMTFYKPKNGILNNFLDQQISLANLGTVEVESKFLDSTSISKLIKEQEEIFKVNHDPLDKINELSQYTYVFYNDDGIIVAMFNAPLDYLDLEKIVHNLQGENQ